MYCNNCGTKLPDNSKFCHVCGEKSILALDTSYTQIIDSPFIERKNKVSLLSLKLTILGLIIAFACLFFYASYGTNYFIVAMIISYVALEINSSSLILSIVGLGLKRKFTIGAKKAVPALILSIVGVVLETMLFISFIALYFEAKEYSGY